MLQCYTNQLYSESLVIPFREILYSYASLSLRLFKKKNVNSTVGRAIKDPLSATNRDRGET